MVGSVLRERMVAEGDFDHMNATYFSTSQVGEVGVDGALLEDATDVNLLSDFDAIITTQGSDYTTEIHPKLRDSGWSGYWIDAASKLRHAEEAIPVLDPVNRSVIDRALDLGNRDLIGANCTVSTMLMGLTPLFTEGHVEWVSDMTYQAASGAGGRHMRELLSQMGRLGVATNSGSISQDILEVDRRVQQELTSSEFPVEHWGIPLAGNVIPWIDTAVGEGQTREEWKGQSEVNNILALDPEAQIAIDGTCVRVGAMRSHAHGLTIKLNHNIAIEEIESMISNSHEWAKFIPNNEEATKKNLTSVAASGDLQIHVGRLRKMTMGPKFLNAFVVGDQLLWGAAEPLRRALRIALDN